MDDDRVVWMDDLATEVCWQLLEGRQIGRVAFVDDRGPMVLPVNFRLDGRSIVVRTARGSILEAIGSGAPVTFEVDGTDAYMETGWSVIARGVASEVPTLRLRSPASTCTRGRQVPRTTGSASSRAR